MEWRGRTNRWKKTEQKTRRTLWEETKRNEEAGGRLVASSGKGLGRRGASPPARAAARVGAQRGRRLEASAHLTGHT